MHMPLAMIPYAGAGVRPRLAHVPKVGDRVLVQWDNETADIRTVSSVRRMPEDGAGYTVRFVGGGHVKIK